MELKYKWIYWATEYGISWQLEQDFTYTKKFTVTLCSFYAIHQALANYSVRHNPKTEVSSRLIAAGAALSNDTQPQGVHWEWKPTPYLRLETLEICHQQTWIRTRALFLLERSYKENRESEKQISLCWRHPVLFCTPKKKKKKTDQQNWQCA